jgi:hypothetical protein
VSTENWILILKNKKSRLLLWMKRSVLQLLLLAFFAAGIASAESNPISARNVHLVSHLDLEGGGMVDIKKDLAVVGHYNLNSRRNYNEALSWPRL